MKKLHIYILVIFLTFACSSTKKLTDKQPFDWLLGTWIMDEPNSYTIEKWERKDSTYFGASSMGKDKKSAQPFETVELKKVNGKYQYIVTGVKDKQVVVFEAVKYTRNSFTVENLKHDYPKRIDYQLITKDSIVAFIDDATSNTKNRYYFHYKKQK